MSLIRTALLSAMDHSNDCGRSYSTMTRRRMMAGTASAGIWLLAGCLGDDDVPDSVAIGDDVFCDNCEMEITAHPGPVGQAHYDAPDEVLEEDRPAYFCSGLCTYTFTFEQEDAGHEPTVLYVTDYSVVDYSVDEGDNPTISAHFDAEAFEAVGDVTMVVDSEVEGAMGASLIGFSDQDDVDDFQDEYGGDRYEHDEITPEVIMALM